MSEPSRVTLRLPDRDGVILFGHVALDQAIALLRFEEQHRVVIAHRALEQDPWHHADWTGMTTFKPGTCA